jgi:E3 ubiquitin-protein ligase XBAT32/33
MCYYYRRIPFEVALKRGHGACAALLNPSAAEPLVWPSPLKFISELDPEAKALLEAALMEANREREKSILKGTKYSLPSPTHSDYGADDAASEVTFFIHSYSIFGLILHAPL